MARLRSAGRRWGWQMLAGPAQRPRCPCSLRPWVSIRYSANRATMTKWAAVLHSMPVLATCSAAGLVNLAIAVMGQQPAQMISTDRPSV